MKTQVKKNMRYYLQLDGIRQLNRLVGGLGLPSKMPGYAYGTSPSRCKLGSKLAKQPSTVCASCYAMRNNYLYPSVKKAHEKRWEAMQDLEAWAGAMSGLLTALAPLVSDEQRYFRWHDSGDLQSVAHLYAIAYVAINNSEWRFKLPTREYGIVRKFTEQYEIPKNLVIRLSALHIDEPPPDTRGLPSSTVGRDVGFQCPARQQENQCGACRECWKRSRRNVNYKKH